MRTLLVQQNCLLLRFRKIYVSSFGGIFVYSSLQQWFPKYG